MNLPIKIVVLAACAISQLSLAQISSEDRDQLIQKYAPLVKLDTEEKYFPSSVQFFIEKSDLKKGPGQTWIQGFLPQDLANVIAKNNDPLIKAQGTFTESDLAGYGQGYYLSGGGFEGWPINAQGYYDAPVYVNFVETPAGAVIQYLFFSPFNGAFQAGQVLPHVPVFGDIASAFTNQFDIGIHIGDWEHIDVYLVKTPFGYVMNDIYFARHSPSSDGGFEAIGKYEVAYGSHPVVYCSKYGHASHPHHSDFHEDRDKTSPNGPEWRTWIQPVYVGTKDQPTPGNEWLQFGGLWGGSSDSPPGPAFQSWWRYTAFQPYPDETQPPLATVAVTSKNQAIQESTAFTVGSVPTFIRNLVWYISNPSGTAFANGQTPPITFSVFDSNNKKLFDISGNQAVTAYYSGSMHIALSAFDGQPSDGTGYTVTVRGLNEMQ